MNGTRVSTFLLQLVLGFIAIILGARFGRDGDVGDLIGAIGCFLVIVLLTAFDKAQENP